MEQNKRNYLPTLIEQQLYPVVIKPNNAMAVPVLNIIFIRYIAGVRYNRITPHLCRHRIGFQRLLAWGYTACLD